MTSSDTTGVINTMLSPLEAYYFGQPFLLIIAKFWTLENNNS